MSDATGRILPWWYNQSDPRCPDPHKMNYGPVRPLLKEPRPQPPYVEGPPAPPVWESKEAIAELYKLLDSVGCKLEISATGDKLANKNDQKRRQQG